MSCSRLINQVRTQCCMCMCMFVCYMCMCMFVCYMCMCMCVCCMCMCMCVCYMCMCMFVCYMCMFVCYMCMYMFVCYMCMCVCYMCMCVCYMCMCMFVCYMCMCILCYMCMCVCYMSTCVSCNSCMCVYHTYTLLSTFLLALSQIHLLNSPLSTFSHSYFRVAYVPKVKTSFKGSISVGLKEPSDTNSQDIFVTSINTFREYYINSDHQHGVSRTFIKQVRPDGCSTCVVNDT